VKRLACGSKELESPPLAGGRSKSRFGTSCMRAAGLQVRRGAYIESSAGELRRSDEPDRPAATVS
jgi:hypothetical protein